MKPSCFLVIFLVFFGMQRCESGFVLTASGPSDALRWDAAAQSFGGSERSLQGGIRYSVQGGSYTSFRDSFSWTVLPSPTDFQSAVQSAFHAWTIPDPVSGLTTSISFTPDFGTAVVGTGTFGGVDFRGAEIDLFGVNAGDSILRGFTSLQPGGTSVTLTSGVSNYVHSSAIAGVDISLNNNSGALYTLDSFRRLLTHEIGHALGLGDVDLGGAFIDDNFSSANPVLTLNNSWTHLVNPLDPHNSAGLSTFSIPGSTFSTPGVDLLMESNGLGIGPSNPLSNLFPLTNDEYGMRQFLYPSVTAVPEPSSMGLVVIALLSLRVPSLAARRKPSKVRI